MARPLRTFNTFVGQRRIVDYVRPLIQGAQAKGEPAPSFVLCGPSGVGKTTLAEAYAAECGTRCRPFLASRESQVVGLCTALSELDAADVLLIDEAHRLPDELQQLLLGVLDEWKIPAISGGRLQPEAEPQSIAPITLLLATNEPGSLRKALRSRLECLDFDTYSLGELKAIARGAAQKVGVELTAQAAGRLAQVAQGTPRLLGMRISRLTLLWTAVTKFTIEEVDKLLHKQGVDHNGLMPLQRQLLSVLAQAPSGNASLELLATKLGRDPAYLRQEVEPFLIDLQVIAFQPGRGRVITDNGRKLVAEFPLPEPDVSEEEDLA
jgi:holliday junction DNA helicase RuvB